MTCSVCGGFPLFSFMHLLFIGMAMVDRGEGKEGIIIIIEYPDRWMEYR